MGKRPAKQNMVDRRSHYKGLNCQDRQPGLPMLKKKHTTTCLPIPQAQTTWQHQPSKGPITQTPSSLKYESYKDALLETPP